MIVHHGNPILPNAFEGVHNLHGMPGILAAIGGAIAAAAAGESAYGMQPEPSEKELMGV